MDAVVHLLATASSLTQTSLHVTDAIIDLDMALASAAKLALSSPVAALEVVAIRAGSGVGLLHIMGIGDEAFPLLLFSRDVPGQWARVWRDDPLADAGRVYVPFEEIKALVESGLLAEGVVSLTSGDSVDLPLPAGSEDAATGGFSFWQAGPGRATRLLTGAWSIAE
jgi:hypothetical protein